MPLASRLSPLASRLSPLASRLSPLASRLSPLGVIVLVAVATARSAIADEIFVRDYGSQGPPPAADGTSWLLAFGTIDDAIEASGADPAADIILVAAAGAGRAWKPGGGAVGAWGVWPGPGLPPLRTSSFVVDDLTGELRIQGGYPAAGGDTVDFDAHPTVLSGDLSGDDQSDLGGWEDINITEIHENAFHVVTIVDNGNVILDGLTIERGNGDDDRDDVPDGFQTGLGGGGVFLTGSKVPVPGYPECDDAVLSFAEATLLNCTIQLNTGLAGAGIAASRHWPVTPESSLPVVTIRNSVVRANRSTDRGGGIAIGYGLLDIAGSVVACNRAVPTGGGIWVSGSYPPPPCLTLPCHCPIPPLEEEGESAGALIVNCTVADNEVTGSSGAGLAWEDVDAGPRIVLESTIVATNRVQFDFDPAWTDRVHQYSAESSCGACSPDPTLAFVAAPTGQVPSVVPTPLTYDIRDPHFLNAGPWIAFDDLGPLERSYQVHRCSFARDLGQPDTALLPRDLFDVNRNGITTGELLPDVVWNARVQESGYWPTGSIPPSPPSLRADIGAVEHADPQDCYFDLDEDGSVGASDLAILLGLWTALSGGLGGGAPGSYENLCLGTADNHSGVQEETPKPCTCIDRDRDGFVGAAELAGLLGAWGGCPVLFAPSGGVEFSGATSLSGSESESFGAVSPAALATLLGFDSLDVFAEWLATLTPEAREDVLSLLDPMMGGG